MLGRKWWEALLLAAGRWVLDYLTLIAALYAVGATPRASLVLLAFCTAQLLGNLPLTPGGLGFVEAGLTGTLALAGVGGGAAVVATLAYRLVSFWLPIPAGAVAAVIHRRRYGTAEVEPPPTPTPEPDRCGSRILARPVLLPPGVDRLDGGTHDEVLLEVLRVVHVRERRSGTGTSRNSQSGSQPSFGSQTSRRSSGTVSITAWFQRSMASAIGPGSPFVPAQSPRSSDSSSRSEVDPGGVRGSIVVLRPREVVHERVAEEDRVIVFSMLRTQPSASRTLSRTLASG